MAITVTADLPFSEYFRGGFLFVEKAYNEEKDNMDIGHSISYSLNFEVTSNDKKKLLWQLFKQYPEYQQGMSEEDFIQQLLPKMQQQYKNHRRSFLRFCGALTSSAQRISYLEQWFEKYINLLYFLVSLPVFITFDKRKKSQILRFVEESEIMAVNVWFVATHLKDQISCTRDLSRLGESKFNPEEDNDDEYDEDLEDA